MDQWLEIKTVVTDAVVKYGGAVSHHHGIGRDHQKWYLESLSSNEQQLLLAIKKHLDPNNILNPGMAGAALHFEIHCSGFSGQR